MGNSDSIDISLSRLYQVWYDFRRGKRASTEVMKYQYYLEENLSKLHTQLAEGTYRHRGYSEFSVQDSKRREIAVASMQDRVVHRLLYNYLERIWDKTFIYDAWSCRKGKGQHEAVTRALTFMRKYAQSWVWRADITKFFDSVDQEIVLRLIKRRVHCPTALWLIEDVLASYSKNSPGRGMPIGNLTSQIFANIYLNELDRLMVHELKPLAYLRYGDDWLCFARSKEELEALRTRAIAFIENELKLSLSTKLNCIVPVYKGVTYLGVDIWRGGLRVMRPTQGRVLHRITSENYASYEAHVRK
ncbi:MAG: reverse transcriptase/maturase family protein, partial [Candidatus Saccharimonadales bacterium]